MSSCGSKPAIFIHTRNHDVPDPSFDATMRRGPGGRRWHSVKTAIDDCEMWRTMGNEEDADAPSRSCTDSEQYSQHACH